MTKHVIRKISAKKLRKMLEETPFPVGIVRRATTKQILTHWETLMNTKDLICLDTSMIPEPVEGPRRHPAKAKYRRIKCANTHHILYFTLEQFELVKGTRWYWYRGNVIQNETGTKIEDYMNLSSAERENKSRALDFRPKSPSNVMAPSDYW